MFNRAVITDEISQDFDLAVGMAKQFGLDQLEIRTVWETRIDAMSSEQLRRIKETAERHGLSVAGLAAPFLKCELGDDDEYAEHLHILRQCIAAGRALGTSLIRGFTFWKRDGLDDHYQQILDSYAEPARIAREEGVTIGIENEGSCYVGTGAELARFLGDLNEPSVWAVWDPANACWDGGETTWADGYPLVKPYIAHVHVKDKRQVNPNESPQAVVIGDGEVDIPGQLQALKNDGYEGCVSLETHYRVTHRLAEDIARMPGGSAFSEGGEEGTRRCLVAWNRMMAALA
jgi:sugar phosphate isomerase/epimerase